MSNDNDDDDDDDDDDKTFRNQKRYDQILLGI